MTKRTSKRKTQKDRGVAGTAFDLAVGGAVLAADKAADIVDEAIDRGGDVARTIREEAGKTAHQGKSSGAKIVRKTRRAGKRIASKARFRTSDAPGREAAGYEDRTKDELYALAANRDIPGRSTMTKQELIKALRSA